MAYVHKIIGSDEKLIGIARLHWIYIIQGVLWFLSFAAIGWIFNMLMARGLYALSNSTSFNMPGPLLALSGGIMTIMMAVGFFIFMFYVLKVVSTDVALTDRRVIHKQGLIFVKSHQIDLEEIRGENLDLGWFGRILGYGSLMLDCRFIGDVKLPNIEKPEQFLRALHNRRANVQDALNLIVGKTGIATPVNVLPSGDGGGGDGKPPEISPPNNMPEISPPQPDQIPPPPNEPMPDAPPPMNDAQSIEAMTTKESNKGLMSDIVLNPPREDKMKAPPSLEQVRSYDHGVDPIPSQQQSSDSDHAPPQNTPPTTPLSSPVLDKETLARVIEQVTPQITQQVVREMTEQGFIGNHEPAQESVEDNLIHVFDDAALDNDEKPKARLSIVH